MNRYKCSKCSKVVIRDSDKKWIKSWCEESEMDTRIVLVKSTSEFPVLIIRNEDNEEFIHIGNGLYRTKWGIMNNSIGKFPIDSFDESLFTFYYK